MSAGSTKIAEARRAATEARERLWATVDEIIDYGQRLQERLEPSNIARDAWDAAKSKGADLAEEAVDAVRKRPVATTGAVAAVAMFLAREPLMDLAGRLWSGKQKTTPKDRKPRRGSRKDTEKVQ